MPTRMDSRVAGDCFSFEVLGVVAVVAVEVGGPMRTDVRVAATRRWT